MGPGNGIGMKCNGMELSRLFNAMNMSKYPRIMMDMNDINMINMAFTMEFCWYYMVLYYLNMGL